jgi:hypothetical protein
METDLIEHLRGIKGWKKKIGATTIHTVKDKKNCQGVQVQKESTS